MPGTALALQIETIPPPLETGFTVTLLLTELLGPVTVTAPIAGLVTVSALAANVVDVEPAPIEMLFGTVKTALLLETVSVTFAAAEFASPTVQVEVLPEKTVVGAQYSPERSVTGADGGDSVRFTLLLTPAAAAVTIAVEVFETLDALAANDADVLPATIVTLAGIDKLELSLLRVAVKPPLGAFPLAATAHVVEPGVLMFDAEQESVLNDADCASVIVPPVPEAAIPLPLAAAATTSLSPREIEEPEGVAAI